MSIHFPFIEGGPVKAICGEWRPKLDWTTNQHAVTCARCHRLLDMEKEPPDHSTSRGRAPAS
jgi:hypothetical protein